MSGTNLSGNLLLVPLVKKAFPQQPQVSESKAREIHVRAGQPGGMACWGDAGPSIGAQDNQPSSITIATSNFE